MSGELNHSYEILIQASPQQVWEALTNSEFTTRYFPGTSVESDWRSGSDYAHKKADGTVAFDGKVIDVDPPRRLIQSVNFKLDPAFLGHTEMTLRWDIEPVGDSCKVTVSHQGSEAVAQLFGRLTGHCPLTMSGLKTLLETGKPLSTGQHFAATR